MTTCLRCGYDVRASAPSGSCPECGASVRASRVAERAEWTEAIGIRRALVHLLWSTPLAAAVLFGVLFAARMPLNWFAANVRGRGASLLLVLIALPIAAVLRWLQWKRLEEAAGFNGAALGTASVLGIAAACAGGALLAIEIAAVAPMPAWMITGGAAGVCLVTIIHDVLTD